MACQLGRMTFCSFHQPFTTGQTNVTILVYQLLLKQICRIYSMIMVRKVISEMMENFNYVLDLLSCLWLLSTSGYSKQHVKSVYLATQSLMLMQLT